MTQRIKSKKTFYNEILFRSKLEAQWAVFFDFLNISYQYEPEWDYVEFGGFQIPYKPDFYLDTLELWVEVKPVEFIHLTDGEIRKIVGWAKDTLEILALVGPPSIPNEKSKNHHLFILNPKNVVKKLSSHWWCICPKCGKIGIELYGSIPYDCQSSCFKEEDFDLFGNDLDYPDGHKAKRLREACAFARNYKF